MALFRAAVGMLVLLTTGSAYAATYGLRDIVTEALQKNPDLRAAGADLTIAEGRALEQEGVNDLILDAGGVVQIDQNELLPGQNPVARAYGFNVQLTQPLPWGGDVGLRATSDYRNNKSVRQTLDDMTMEVVNVTETSTSYNPAVQLVLDVPLLRGLGPSAARGRLRSARIQRDAARLQREATAAVVLRDVAIAYWELRFAVETLNLNKQLADSAREQLEIVNANIQAGKLPPSASAEVIVATGLRDEQVLLSQSAVLERSLLLRRLAGMPIGVGNTTIDANDSLESNGDDGNLAQALSTADTHSPALLAARASGNAAAIDLDVTANGKLPQLDLSVAAGPSGSADDLSTALDQMSSFKSYSILGTLTFHQPLQHRAASGQTLQARGALRKARFSEEAIANQTAEAVVRLHALTDEARHRLDVIAPTTEAASVDLNAEKARFEVGRATNFDVLRRQEELAQTQLRQARARVDLLTARAALWAATGEILDKFGVTVR